MDGVHRHVFISDPKTDSVVVADYTGKAVGRIVGETGGDGMVLSQDSGTLYVALPGADAISAVDTVTFKETARYATGAHTAPLDLALAGGKLWFGYGEYAREGGNIGSLDLSGAVPVVTLDQSGGVPWESAPQLTTTPGATGESSSRGARTAPRRNSPSTTSPPARRRGAPTARRSCPRASGARRTWPSRRTGTRSSARTASRTS
ncbi:hypothetical protein F3K43_38475 [Streptomyces sp. LBUM 1476]|nr:hypothetical protein [Streptomyces sp. LBUM 1476]